jgi:hypothetical protein
MGGFVINRRVNQNWKKTQRNWQHTKKNKTKTPKHILASMIYFLNNTEILSIIENLTT